MNRSIGDYYEKIAKNILIHNNFKILQQNVILSPYEIDIIAYKKSIIHFIEVRKIESLNPILNKKKISSLINAINIYINKKNIINSIPISLDYFIINSKLEYKFIENITLFI